MKRFALLASVWLASASSALAAERSVSYSTWVVAGPNVTVRILLPADEARRLTATSVPLLTGSKLGAYLLQHLSVQAGGHDCPAIDQGYDIGRVDPLSVGRDFYGFEIMFRCDGVSERVLRNTVLLEVAPRHVDFARLELDGRTTQQLFSAGHERLRLPDAGTVRPASIGRYMALGARHLVFSLDRCCVLFALVLLAQRWRDLAFAIIGLAIGYALVGIEAIGGWIVPRMMLLDAFVGWIVALLAVGTVALGSARQRALSAYGASALLLLAALLLIARGASPALLLCGAAALTAAYFMRLEGFVGRETFWLASGAVIGVVDGFVLPSMLEPLNLASRALLPMLSAFALGALLSAALLLAALTMTVRYWQWRAPWPLVSWVRDLFAAALAGLGSYWLLSRLYA